MTENVPEATAATEALPPPAQAAPPMQPGLPAEAALPMQAAVPTEAALPTEAAPPAQAAPPAAAGRSPRFGPVFAVVVAGVSVVNMDMFIVNVAIPSIGRSFGGADLSALSWVLNAYAIVFAALLVPAGRAADLIGRRTAFLAGMILFGLASAGCAAAPDVWVLVVARVVQAAGGALLMPASLGLLLAAAPPDRRVAAIRAWTSVGGAAAALGPVVGGALVAASWHWVFLVNVPIVAIAVIVGVRILPATKPSAAAVATEEAEALPDILGAVAFTVAIGALALGLVKADDWGWGSPRLLVTLAVGVVLLAWFARRSSRHPAPVIEPHLLRDPVFATATAANVVFGIAFGAMLLLVTLWCQDVWHWSALRTGLAVAPGPLLVPFWSIAAGPIARRVGPGPVAAVGCAIYAAGCVFWRLNLAVTPDYVARMLPGMLLTGTGVGLVLPSLVSAAVSAVPPQRFATGSGIVTMARQVGIVLGIAILVTVLGQPSGAGALEVFQHGTVVLAAAAFGAGLVALLLIPAGRARQASEAPAGSAPAGSGPAGSTPVGSASAGSGPAGSGPPAAVAPGGIEAERRSRSSFTNIFLWVPSSSTAPASSGERWPPPAGCRRRTGSSPRSGA